MSITRRENIGYTSSGIQEICRWTGSTPCPRHKKHGVLKLDQSVFETLNLFENPAEPAGGLTLTSYLIATEEKPEDRNGYAETVEDLTPLEKIKLEDSGKVKVDDVWYAEVNGWLEEIRVIENEDDLTDMELRELQEVGFINIDGVGYFFNKDGDFRISENEHGQIMGMLNRHIMSIDTSLPEYIDKHADKGEVLNLEVEQWFMTGGCGVYALALQELNPSYEIAADKYWYEGEDLYNHVFCVDPKTGRAYDSRGEFANAEALIDYKTDPHSGIVQSDGEDAIQDLPDFFEDDGYVFWSRQQAEHMVGVGTFSFVTDSTDQEYIKQLITGFKKRYTL
jgi:hypothetical protein